MPKHTLEEKRLQTLRQQLYGKEEPKQTSLKSAPKKISYTSAARLNPTATVTSAFTTPYLKQDLLKVTVLTLIAIGSQLLLYFLLRNQMLKLNFLSF